jgi:hypothetical protein
MYSKLHFGDSHATNAASRAALNALAQTEATPAAPALLQPKESLGIDFIVRAPGFKGPSKEEVSELEEHTKSLTWRETSRDGTKTECKLTEEQYKVLKQHGGVQKWTNEDPRGLFGAVRKDEFFAGQKRLTFTGVSGSTESEIQYFPTDPKQPYYCIVIQPNGRKTAYKSRAEFNAGEGYK